MYWHILEKSIYSIQVSSALNTHKLYPMVLDAGLEDIVYETYFKEWRPPLQPTDLPYLEFVSHAFGTFARELELNKKELSLLNKLIDTKSPDYYWREAFALLVCKVPI